MTLLESSRRVVTYTKTCSVISGFSVMRVSSFEMSPFPSIPVLGSKDHFLAGLDQPEEPKSGGETLFLPDTFRVKAVLSALERTTAAEEGWGDGREGTAPCLGRDGLLGGQSWRQSTLGRGTSCGNGLETSTSWLGELKEAVVAGVRTRGKNVVRGAGMGRNMGASEGAGETLTLTSTSL